MPLKNRITPYGNLIATPARGYLMGNRGILVDKTGTIRRKWATKAWITCLLSYKGNRQPLSQPGTYTPLFFHDEATALAAGHRPCAYCRRDAFKLFVDCWVRGNGASTHYSTKEIDAHLHRERVTRAREKVLWQSDLAALPSGVFIELPGLPGTAWLIRDDELFQWHSEGYGQRRERPTVGVVKVLTPESIVKAIRAGYEPQVAL